MKIDKHLIRQLVHDTATHIARTKLIPPITLDELRQIAQQLIRENPKYKDYENWTILFLNNAFWSDVVAGIPFKRRLLLIPQCLKHSESCPARIDGFGLLCEACGACVIHEIQSFADELGLMCIVAEGSTITAQLIEEGEVDAIFGVSCFNALEKAFSQMISHGMPGMALPLYGEGCKNTSTDTQLLKEMLARHSDKGPLLQHLKPLLDRIKSWFSEENLNSIMGKVNGRSEEIAREWMVSDGKRYRPFLCVATAQSLGIENIENEALMKLAIAVECFHKASLVHDDIEDEDSFRNGQPALHIRHGIPIALNTGDLLLGEGYRMISELNLSSSKKVALLRIASTGHLVLCRGQGEELLCSRQQKWVHCNELVQIFQQKTAPAFNVAFQFGAILMNATKREKLVMEKFSQHLGIAYQIMDDLRDVTREELNKTLHDKTPENKKTLFRMSIVESIMHESGFSYEKASLKARELLSEYKNNALLSLRPLQNFALKRLLFQVTHSILKD
ncbi:MAG: polyprenyl synthetase family protein [Candidatus Riflebacteria bacterium]|nr:polyprenyl synthetase family protein [Candidatus Riflebacteria bacterium]